MGFGPLRPFYVLAWNGLYYFMKLLSILEHGSLEYTHHEFLIK